ncbi:MAG: response regulator [Firmicutes bacterium]|nr:response regulator [Bacillota bacterium]
MKSLRVLVVEDSEDDLHLIRRELVKGGYDPVVRRVDSASALRKALEDDAWDVIVCDYAMPRFSARGALQILKEVGLDIPFIVVSGQIGEDTAVAMMRAGAHDYLMKDNLTRLVPAIDRELREAAIRRERRRAEEELRAANLAKDRFLAMLSHELRNPLAAITTAIDALAMRAPAEPGYRGALDVLRRGVDMQVRLVNDLLDLSRISVGKLAVKLEPLQLGPVVAAAVEEFRPLAERQGISLTMGPPARAWVDGDGHRLRQVIGNLLDNAIKFTPQGGRVEVTMDASGGRVRVSITDTGVGMSEAERGRVFDMFRQGSGAAGDRQGLGIGLALVKGLVELHGGRVWAESEGPGRGACFTIEMSTRQPPVETMPSGNDPVTDRLEGLQIVIIEDNIDLLRVLGEVLRLEGCEVHAFASAEDALASMGQQPPPDAILCDLSLPGIDGREFLRRARGMPGMADVPVLALTGYGEAADVRASRAAGFYAHLIKPVPIAELRATLVEAVRHARDGRAGPIGQRVS